MRSDQKAAKLAPFKDIMNSSSMSAGAVPTIKCEEASPTGAGSEGAGGGAAGGGGGGGYNLSVNVNLGAAVSNLLAAESAASTPRTPEILNSLIAMTSPLEQYNNFTEKTTISGFKPGCGNDSNSSLSNGSSATSPASSTPPSIQKTCSELIKAGLKLSIESKRKMSSSDTESCIKKLKKEDSDDEYDSSHTMTKSEGLTPEDEERRRRRRERNKIAATKCRMKKRERTVNLVTESEVLESQNIDLKSQLKDLEVQRRQLIDMLSVHTASCIKNNTASPSPTATYNMIRPYESPTPFPTSYDASSPYIRPESANVLASSYTCVTPLTDTNGDIVTLDNAYMPQQLLEGEYHRAESVLGLQGEGYVADGYLHKVIDAQETEYYDPEASYGLVAAQAQQCHAYPAPASDSAGKLAGGLNDGCLV